MTSCGLNDHDFSISRCSGGCRFTDIGMPSTWYNPKISSNDLDIFIHQKPKGNLLEGVMGNVTVHYHGNLDHAKINLYSHVVYNELMIIII